MYALDEKQSYTWFLRSAGNIEGIGRVEFGDAEAFPRFLGGAELIMAEIVLLRTHTPVH